MRLIRPIKILLFLISFEFTQNRGNTPQKPFNIGIQAQFKSAKSSLFASLEWVPLSRIPAVAAAVTVDDVVKTVSS